jgi:hypothetical protein
MAAPRVSTRTALTPCNSTRAGRRDGLGCTFVGFGNRHALARRGPVDTAIGICYHKDDAPRPDAGFGHRSGHATPRRQDWKQPPINDEVRDLHPHVEGQDQAERHGQARLPEGAPMPVNGQDHRRVQGIRDRSRKASGVRRGRLAIEYGMADHGGSQGEGQDGARGLREPVKLPPRSLRRRHTRPRYSSGGIGQNPLVGSYAHVKHRAGR